MKHDAFDYLAAADKRSTLPRPTLYDLAAALQYTIEAVRVLAAAPAEEVTFHCAKGGSTPGHAFAQGPAAAVRPLMTKDPRCSCGSGLVEVHPEPIEDIRGDVGQPDPEPCPHLAASRGLAPCRHVAGHDGDCEPVHDPESWNAGWSAGAAFAASQYIADRGSELREHDHECSREQGQLDGVELLRSYGLRATADQLSAAIERGDLP